MQTKECKQCKCVKVMEDFYTVEIGSNVRISRCKECIKANVRKHRSQNLAKVHEYDRMRSKTESRKKKTIEYQRNRRSKDRTKDKARAMAQNAAASGKIEKTPCIICGNPKVEAHHHDYSKPLEVTWYCFKHHREYGHGQIVTVE